FLQHQHATTSAGHVGSGNQRVVTTTDDDDIVRFHGESTPSRKRELFIDSHTSDQAMLIGSKCSPRLQGPPRLGPGAVRHAAAVPASRTCTTTLPKAPRRRWARACGSSAKRYRAAITGGGPGRATAPAMASRAPRWPHPK